MANLPSVTAVDNQSSCSDGCTVFLRGAFSCWDGTQGLTHAKQVFYLWVTSLAQGGEPHKHRKKRNPDHGTQPLSGSEGSQVWAPHFSVTINSLVGIHTFFGLSWVIQNQDHEVAQRSPMYGQRHTLSFKKFTSL
jgi:hypothetical protein